MINNHLTVIRDYKRTKVDAGKVVMNFKWAMNTSDLAYIGSVYAASYEQACVAAAHELTRRQFRISAQLEGGFRSTEGYKDIHHDG